MKINRKTFLELTSALAGSAVFTSTMPWFSVFNNPAPAGASASDTVRLGIVGVGSRGRALLLNLLELEQRMNMQVVAVCDNYEPHYQRAIKLTGGNADAFYDYRKMVEESGLDGVVIATPLHEHAHIAIGCMQAGLHVYCEKSMARHLDDTKQMYDTHIEQERVLLIGHQRLFSPVYLQAMQRIKEGKIGQITMMKAWWHRNRPWIFYDVPGGRGSALDRRLNWRLYDEFSAGMITELGSHHFQVANWVLDAEPLSVMGTGSINFWKDGREVYDNFSLIFQYPEGIQFTYDCITSNKHNGMQVQVLGHEATMELESNKRFLENPPKPPAIRTLLHNIESDIFETIPIGGATWVPAEPVSQGGEYISDDYQMNETLLYLEGFINFIRKGKAPEKLTIEGYNATKWALLAEQATKQRISVTSPKELIL